MRDLPRILRTAGLCVVVSIVALAILPGTASAAYPGENGKIAWEAGCCADVYVMNANGTNFVNLTASRDAPARTPSYSPDGSKIAFTSLDELWVMNGDGSNQHLLAEDVYAGGGTNPGRPAWAPNGDRIAMLGPGGVIKILNSTSGAVVDTLDPPPPPAGGSSSFVSAAWKPSDPSVLAAAVTTIDASSNIGYDIFRVPLAGSSPIALTSDPGIYEFSLDWAPDGSRLAFTQFDNDGSTELDGIYALPADGGSKIPLTSTAADVPAHSPDGSRIVFSRQVSFSNRDLYTMDSNGSNVQPLLTGLSDDYSPSWQPVPEAELVVISTKDAADTDTADGACDSDDAKAGNQCTLRAAIQEANARDGADEITFEIKKKDSKVIEPESPLPVVAEQLEIDGLSQPGASSVKLLIELSGKSIPSATGLTLQGADSEVRGLVVRSFKDGIGVSLEGTGGHLIQSNWFGVESGRKGFKSAPNHVGVEVSAADATIDANKFSASGDFKGLTNYAGGLDREGSTPEAQHAASLRGFGAGLHLEGGAQSTSILSNEFGAAPDGSRLGSSRPEFGPIEFGNVAGILIGPSSGTVVNTTIGGSANAQGNVFSGNFAGVMALGAAGSVAGVDISHNFIGPRSFDKPAAGIGNVVGVVAGGNVSALDLGGAGGLGNDISGNVIGVLAGGAGVTNARIENNDIGTDKNLKDAYKSLSKEKPSLGYHNLIGLILGNTQNLSLGGTSGLGNRILGNALGVHIGGSTSQANVVAGNAVGLGQAPAGKIDKLAVEKLGSLVGVLHTEGTQNQIGTIGGGNSFAGTAIGLFSAETTFESVQANTFDKNAFGQLAAAPAGMTVGGSVAGAGNSYVNGGLGLAMVHKEPSKGEREATRTDDNPVGKKDRREPYKAENTDLALDTAAPFVGDLDLTVGGFEIDPPDPGTDNAIRGNHFGTDAGGAKLGNWVGAVVAGDITETVFGTGSGSTTEGANTVARNRVAGVWVGPQGSAQTQVDLRGNSIFDNHTFAGPSQGLQGLGVDLLPPGAVDPDDFGLSFGITPNDLGDADTGANGRQNYPEITEANDTGGGALTIDGSLSSKPATMYSIELYASTSCGRFGFGEGETMIKRYDVVTNGSGVASIATTSSLPPGKRKLTTTATGPEGTSEFSECVSVP